MSPMESLERSGGRLPGGPESACHVEGGLADVGVEARESDFVPSRPTLMSGSKRRVVGIWELGKRIDDFDLIKPLGEGSFGVVFLARQISLDREVALKVTANLGQEGRTMACLEHTHVVPVYSEVIDAGQDLRLLCMKYIPGATLRQIIVQLRRVDRCRRSGQVILEIIDRLSAQRAALDPSSLRDREILARCQLDEAVCRIGRSLAAALAHAHGQGVLHCDIKPANVIVNQYGQPMLTDFSVSHRSTPAPHAAAAVVGGTLGYMAPEQLEAMAPPGRSGLGAVGPRSDIYSLGMVLCELYTGISPRQLETIARSDERPADDGVPEDGCRPRDSLQSCAAPPPLAMIIRKCLDPRPQRRYASAHELAESLDGCCAVLGAQRALPPPGVITRCAERHPVLFLLSLTVVPNVLASMVNVAYNSLVVIRDLAPEQQSAFFQMVVGYNLGVVVLMALMVERTLLAAARRWRALDPSSERARDGLRRARRDALRLPGWGVVLGCVGWLPFVVVIPLGMELLAGPINRGVLLHVSCAFFVTGVIAIVYNYFCIAFVALRVMYLRLWGDGYGFGREARGELHEVPGRNRTFQVLAGLTPLLAAAMLALVGPEPFTPESLDRFRATVSVLIGVGVAGFWLAMTSTGLLNRCVAVIAARSGESHLD